VSLDDVLGAWADSVRLSEDAAGEIRERIVRSDPELSPSWWRQFSVDYTANIVACTRVGRWAA
jgi:hypothetical protein